MNMLHKTGLTNLLFEEMGELSQSEEEYWTDRSAASAAGYTPDSMGATAYSSGLKNPSEYSKQSSADFSSMDDDAITSHIKNEFKQWVQTEFEDCGLEMLSGVFSVDDDIDRSSVCPPEQQFALLVDAYALMSKRPQQIFKGLNQAQTNAAKAALAEIRDEINEKIKAGHYDAIILAAPKPPKLPKDTRSAQDKKDGVERNLTPEQKAQKDAWSNIHGDIKKQLSAVRQRIREEGEDAVIQDKWEQYSALPDSQKPDPLSEEEFKKLWSDKIGKAKRMPSSDSGEGSASPTQFQARVSKDDPATQPVSITPLNGEFPVNANNPGRMTYAVALSAETFEKWESEGGWTPGKKGGTERCEAIAAYVMGKGRMDQLPDAQSEWVQGDSVNYDVHVTQPGKLLDGAWEVKQIGGFTKDGASFESVDADADDAEQTRQKQASPTIPARAQLSTGSTRLGQGATVLADRMKGDIEEIARTMIEAKKVLEKIDPSQMTSELQAFKNAVAKVADESFSSGNTVLQLASTGELSSKEGWQALYEWLWGIKSSWEAVLQQINFNPRSNTCAPDINAIKAWIKTKPNGQKFLDGLTVKLRGKFETGVLGAENIKVMKAAGAKVSASYDLSNQSSIWKFLDQARLAELSGASGGLPLEAGICAVTDAIQKYKSGKTGFLHQLFWGYMTRADDGTPVMHGKSEKQVAQMVSSLSGHKITVDGEEVFDPGGEMNRTQEYFAAHRKADEEGISAGVADVPMSEPGEPRSPLEKALFLDPRNERTSDDSGASDEIVRYNGMMKGFIFVFIDEPPKADYGTRGAVYIVDILPRMEMIKQAKEGNLGVGQGLTQNKPKIWWNPPGGTSWFQQASSRAMGEFTAPGGELGEFSWQPPSGDENPTAYKTSANRRPWSNQEILDYDNSSNIAAIKKWVKSKTGVSITNDEAKKLMKAAIGIKVQQGKYRHDFNRNNAELIDGKYQIDGDPKTLSSDEYNDWADWFNKQKPSKPVNLAASHNPKGERLEEKQSVFDGGSVGRSMGDWIDWSVRRK